MGGGCPEAIQRDWVEARTVKVARDRKRDLNEEGRKNPGNGLGKGNKFVEDGGKGGTNNLGGRSRDRISRQRGQKGGQMFLGEGRSRRGTNVKEVGGKKKKQSVDGTGNQSGDVGEADHCRTTD